MALASLVGCAGAKTTAKGPESLPPHLSVAMDDETARALLADDDLMPVSVTTLTGADFYVTVPMKDVVTSAADLPNERGPVNIMRTWGVDPVDPPNGIPDTRE
jgi:hypothetical protein